MPEKFNGTEFKRDFTARLKRENRWDDFVKVRERLKSEGSSPAVAWREAAKHFTPLPETEVSPDDDEDDLDEIDSEGEGEALPEGVGDDFVDPSLFQAPTAPYSKVVDWVARNLTNKDVKPEECICSKAWRMRNWVLRDAKNESLFWSNIFPKGEKAEGDEKKRALADDREQDDLIAELERYIANHPDEMLTGTG